MTEAQSTVPQLDTDKAITVLKQAVVSIATDIEDGLRDEVIASLALLKTEKTPAYLRFRSELRSANSAVRLSTLDAMVSKLSTVEEQTNGPGSVEALVSMTQAVGELFLGTDDQAYVRFKRDGHFEVWALESAGFKEWIARTYYEESGRVPRTAQLADALVTLSGKARHEGETHQVHLRTAVDPSGGYLIDIGDNAWRVIRITESGWKILSHSPVRFRRTRGTQALPLPESNCSDASDGDDTNSGSIADLMKLINVRESDQLLVVAAVIECYRPDTAFPVIEWCGEEGSAKSTSAANLRRLIDPRDVLLRANPKAIEDIFVAARQNYVINYNNLSRLSGDMQDAFCTLSTGGGYAARRLYTNDEESVYDVKRPVFINGISILVTQSDLLSRVVRIECPSFVDGSRISDGDMEAIFKKHAPKAMRFLLDTFCSALKLLPTIELDKAPRLMDFTKLGEAVAISLGYKPGHFSTIYASALKAAAIQSIEDEPVIEVLVRYIKKYMEFDGTVGELLTNLENHPNSRRDSTWPKRANGLSTAMVRAAPALRAVGISVKPGPKSNVGRRVRVTFTPSSIEYLPPEESVTNVTSVTSIKNGDASGASDANFQHKTIQKKCESTAKPSPSNCSYSNDGSLYPNGWGVNP